ncbi:MAG: hypothetical protein J7M25_11340, partial [Deltaproteobacteria bacterium]|nr:hypothetical protein [Deltaproteobacteria bacterium]
IVDFTNAAQPSILYQHDSDFHAGPGGAALKDGYLYAAGFWPGDPEGLSVYNVATPSSPQLVTRVGSQGGYEIARQGNLLFLLRSLSVLVIFDVTNPASPQELATLTLPAVAQRIVPVGQQYVLLSAFASNPDPGWQLIDVSDPRHPTVSDRYDPLIPGADVLAVHGGYAFAVPSNQLLSFDLSDWFYPKMVGAIPFNDVDYNHGNRIDAIGFWNGYMVASGAGVNVFDISDPVRPILAAYHMHGNQRQFRIEGGMAVTSDGIVLAYYQNQGLSILALSVQ